MEKSVANGAVVFGIVVGGRLVREYHHEGKVYVAGQHGQHYSLRLHNKTSRRVLAVVTVDGKSIMDGQPGTKDGNGYVLEPWQSADIPGWRLNDSEVAAFEFGSKESSYAAKTGAPANVGVIGAAFFHEVDPIYVPRPVPRHTYGDDYKGVTSRGMGSSGGASRGFGTMHSLGHAPEDDTLELISARNASPVEREEKTSGGIQVPDVQQARQALGTQFGHKADHQIGRTTFNRRHPEIALFEIHYNDAENLRIMGVNLDVAEAFPGDKDKPITACQPPEDWKA